MPRITRNSVNSRLNRNTFCSGAEPNIAEVRMGVRMGFKGIFLQSHHLDLREAPLLNVDILPL